MKTNFTYAKYLQCLVLTIIATVLSVVVFSQNEAPLGASVPSLRTEDSPQKTFQEPIPTDRFGTTNSSFVLDFEGLGCLDNIQEFYNGGTSSAGFSGTDYGVSFGTFSLALLDSDDSSCTGNIGLEPSGITVMFFLEGEAVLNLATGFDTGFSFEYASANNFGGEVTVYSELDGMGDVLGSATFDSTGAGPGDPNGTFSNWEEVSIAFDGTAKSIVFGGTPNQIVYDDITFGNVVAGCDASGGEIITDQETTEVTGCAGTSEVDEIGAIQIGTTSGDNIGWVITDAGSGEILGLPQAPPFDLSAAPPGVCNIYQIGYDDGLTGLMMGANIENLDGCFDLSNPIVVTRENCDPGNMDCPPEDVVLRSQADIEAFAAAYPNCNNMPVGIFITEDMATSGDVMDLSPLDFIDTIDGHLVFWKAPSLTSLSGLEGLTSVSGVVGLNWLRNLSDLNGLSGLESVGWLQIASVRSLTSLSGMSSLMTIEDKVVISNNRNLSFCAIEPVCSLLEDGKPAVIFNNEEGCGSKMEVEEECSDVDIDSARVEVELFPNPVSSNLNIKNIELTSKTPIVNVLDQTGTIVKTIDILSQKGGRLTMDVSTLSTGIYYLQIQDDDVIYNATFLKE